MTSNVGAVLIKRQTALGFGAIAGHGSYEAMRDKILDESKRVFKPEFFVREHQSRCMVVDPLSAIAKAGAALAAGRVAERLICLRQIRRHHPGVHQPIARRSTADGGNARANLDNCGHLDSPHEHQSSWGTESRAQHRQIARYETLQPGARTHPER
ncbi:MAG TPA: hypothetical protein VGY91_13255 [Chthoniobacterales bacterium]|nr:hypothetical protein [Chthoniobacterales bacterium]